MPIFSLPGSFQLSDVRRQVVGVGISSEGLSRGIGWLCAKPASGQPSPPAHTLTSARLRKEKDGLSAWFMVKIFNKNSALQLHDGVDFLIPEKLIEKLTFA
jgi:hypothetical protein